MLKKHLTPFIFASSVLFFLAGSSVMYLFLGERDFFPLTIAGVGLISLAFLGIKLSLLKSMNKRLESARQQQSESDGTGSA